MRRLRSVGFSTAAASPVRGMPFLHALQCEARRSAEFLTKRVSYTHLSPYSVKKEAAIRTSVRLFLDSGGTRRPSILSLQWRRIRYA